MQVHFGSCWSGSRNIKCPFGDYIFLDLHSWPTLVPFPPLLNFQLNVTNVFTKELRIVCNTNLDCIFQNFQATDKLDFFFQLFFTLQNFNILIQHKRNCHSNWVANLLIDITILHPWIVDYSIKFWVHNHQSCCILIYEMPIVFHSMGKIIQY